MSLLRRETTSAIAGTMQTRTWSTPDGRYAIIEGRSLLGRYRRFYAIRRLPNGNELPLCKPVRRRKLAVNALKATLLAEQSAKPVRKRRRRVA